MNDSIKKSDSYPGMNRRTFLKASAFSGLVLFLNRFIKFQKLPLLSSGKSTEGVLSEEWIPTSCLNCATRCATHVRVVNGKAVRIEGNPLSKVSEGKICPRGHIGLQVLYDPSRVTTPLKRTNPEKGRGIDPKWTPISWNQAVSEVSNHLKTLREKGQPNGLLLFEGLNTISTQDMMHRFAQAYGTPNFISGDSLEKQAEIVGRWLADGNYEHIAYDMGQTNYILAFGAGILESEKPFARNLRMWGKIRRERPNRAKVVVIDPRYSVTAAKSDQWLPINPGTDGALAMGIANVIINENLYDADFVQTRTAGFQEYKDLVLNEYSPDRVAAITGIEAPTIRQIAREFAQTKPAIAWTGRGVCGWPNGSYNSYAVFCLNALTGNIDVPGGVIYQEVPGYNNLPELVMDEIARQGNARPKIGLDNATSIPGAGASVNKVADAILNNEHYLAEMAIGFSSNFNMSAPDTERWDRAMKKLPYYVHIAPFASEMAEYADIILPATTFLEEWGYDHSPPGSGFAEVKLKQPAVKPMPDARSTVDIIFEIARELGGTIARAFTGIGDNAEGFAKCRTETLLPWDEFRGKGVWVGSAYQYRKYDSIFHTSSGKFEFYSGNLGKTGMSNGRLSSLPHYEEVKFIGDKNTYPLVLSTYQPLLDVENGGQNYPWAQENYLILQGIGWTNFAEINRETAHALNIKDGDLVWVESQVGRIKAKARVTEEIHPQIVSIASGQGHWTGGKWQKDIGVNPNEVMGVDYDGLSGQSAHLNTRVKIYRV